MTSRTDLFNTIARARRLPYANGMMLDEFDFTAEQDYHRRRLGLALAYLHGYGTVAGLDVTFDAGGDDEIRVSPGLAIDPLGRLIEVPRVHCLTVGRWYEQKTEDPESADQLDQAFQVGGGTTPDHVRTHVFLSFRVSEQGKTPAFQTGNFDALDAVAPSRLLDAFEIKLLIGTHDTLTVASVPLPDPVPADPAARLAEINRHKIEDAWREPLGAVEGEPRIELSPALLIPGQESTDVLLADVMIPATAGSPPTRNEAIDVAIDIARRPFSYSSAELLWLTSNGS